MAYKIGDKVWVKPIDWQDLIGVVIGFQQVEPYNPIIEIDYLDKKIIKAFSLNEINPFVENNFKKQIITILQDNSKDGWDGNIEAVAYVDFEKVAKDLEAMFSKSIGLNIEDKLCSNCKFKTEQN
jgi:hypothetical protein